MIKNLALIIPDVNGSPLPIATPPGFKSGFKDLGSTVSLTFQLVFVIAGFLVLFWFAWGVFQYIFAGGKKEELAKARGRITWAIAGFIFLAISFLISQYAQSIFPHTNNLTRVSSPGELRVPCTKAQADIQKCDLTKYVCLVEGENAGCFPR